MLPSWRIMVLGFTTWETHSWGNFHDLRPGGRRFRGPGFIHPWYRGTRIFGSPFRVGRVFFVKHFSKSVPILRVLGHFIFRKLKEGAGYFFTLRQGKKWVIPFLVLSALLRIFAQKSFYALLEKGTIHCVTSALVRPTSIQVWLLRLWLALSLIDTIHRYLR